VINHFGEPKALTVQEVPTPQPKNGEALVAVQATSINPSDVKNVAGAMHGTTLPRIPGRDYAGVVVRGPNDWIGREVFGTGGDIGFTRDGSHAQFLVLPIAALTPKPAKLSMDEAGAAGLTFVAAWSAMINAASVRTGDVALIVGASGGVGSAAVQIAKAMGARVIGAVRSDVDADTARAFGADEAVNTRTANLAEKVGSFTSGKGADVVFDTSGMMFSDGVEAAAHGGRILVISAPPDGKAAFNLRNMYRKELRVIGIDTLRLDAIASTKLLAAMTTYFDSGQFRVQPVQPHPLADAVVAYEQASHGGAKRVLRPND
jgi:NADPH:quinone reductase-like Zn-dependent oxidoreductase